MYDWYSGIFYTLVCALLLGFAVLSISTIRKQLWPLTMPRWEGNMKLGSHSVPLAFLLILILSYLMLLFLDEPTIASLAAEDGVIEWAGALGFLATALLFLVKFWKDKPGNDLVLFKTKKNLFYLLFGMLFLFGFGEEISWGQRVLALETPQALQTINTQGEINIHNLRIFHGVNAEGERKSFVGLLLNADRLFSLFWLTFYVLIPVLYALSPMATRWLKRINLPVVSAWVSPFFVANYLLSVILGVYVRPTLSHEIVEAKEANFGLFLMLSTIYLFAAVDSAQHKTKTSRDLSIPAAPPQLGV